MREETLEKEVEQLRAELAQARALIAGLRAELDRLQNERTTPPPFVKPNTPNAKSHSTKQPRRKRAKEQNGARKRDTPTQTIQHKVDQCPTCAYPLRHAHLAGQRQVIELPPPQPLEVIEHQLYKSWCASCQKWHYASVDLSTQVMGQSRMGVRIASLTAYLRTSLRLPIRLIREYLHSMHNLLLSKGEITNLLHRVAETDEWAVSIRQAAGLVNRAP